MKKSFSLGLFFLFTLSAIPADATFNLKWDPSPGLVDGYQVYYGTDQGVHPYNVDVGNATEYPLDLLPLDGGVTYYFVVTAYNQAGESGPSNEVHWKMEEESGVQPDEDVAENDDGGGSDLLSDVDVNEGDGGIPSSDEGGVPANDEGENSDLPSDGGDNGGETVSDQEGGAQYFLEIFMDDGDGGTSSTGIWRPSSGSDAYGGSSLYNYLSGTYSYEKALNGRFEISLWWSAYPNRCGSVPVKIYDGEGLVETVSIDQRSGGGVWNRIGTYAFSQRVKVVLESKGWCATCADAVRFLEQEGGGSDVPPEIVVNDVDGGTSPSDDSTSPWVFPWTRGRTRPHYR